MDSRDIILKLISEKFPSDKAFEEAAGLKPKTVDSWKRGNSRGYLKMLPELSEIFGVTTDYLLGNDPPFKSPIEPIDKEGFELFRNLPSEKKRQALDYLRFLHDSK